MSGEIVPLSPDEQQTLSVLETKIQDGISTFMDVGIALLEIREKKLYRQYGTFEMYCKKRWNFSRQHGYRLMDAVEFANNLSPVGDIPNEHTLRAFAGLRGDPVAQQLAAVLAIESAQRVGMDKPTPAIYHAAVDAVKELRDTGHVTIDQFQLKPNEPVPAEIASVINIAAEIVSRQQTHISNNSNWQRLEAFEGVIGEVEAWINSLVTRHGGAHKVKVVVYEEKPEDEQVS